MILSGLEILKRMNESIIIKPFDKKSLNPNSYNLSLHNELLIYEEEILDMKKNNRISKVTIPPEGLILKPGILYLGRTVEYTETRDLVPVIEGRSSLGRLGISIHLSSPYGNVGFKGYWTLEISCIQPVKIYAGVEVCQIYYHHLDGEFLPYLNGKYNGNTGIQASKLFEEF
ncbi:dCTP deaminase [Planococcus faecalis]|uniref:dCTP deaminase n=1 Tax=Planococcus faecalis TaxID=1598147 RepID=A0ABM6IQY0_9BACL|nr:dCTP deaminase [Planococcus faecalis]AQU78997.1 dCTP deaminase [Planococcus faecalis]OHX54735.1 deoxycytidine triphosphate deaminase [Planococcus faecalis]